MERADFEAVVDKVRCDVDFAIRPNPLLLSVELPGEAPCGASHGAPMEHLVASDGVSSGTAHGASGVDPMEPPTELGTSYVPRWSL